MKKIISFLAVAILISSCGNKMTLLKRHYTNGYYMHVHKDVNGVKMAKVSGEPENIQNREINLSHEVKGPDLVVYSAGAIEEQAKTNETKRSKEAAQQRKEAIHSTWVAPHLKPMGTIDNFGTGAARSSGGSSVPMIILVLLAIFVPPLAVYLKNGETNKWFWVTLILCLLAFTYFIFVFGGSLWFAAFVIALLYVFDVIS